MHKKIERALLVLTGITFFVPLIVMAKSFIFPFIVPKIVIFRSLVVVMLVLYAFLLAMRWKEYARKPGLLHYTVSAFMLSFIISTFIGEDPYRSFWDNHERMLGLFTVFHYFLYFVILSSVVKKWQEWVWLLRTFLAAGALVMCIGLIQKINPDFLLNRGAARVVSTLGNAIYVSGYSIFLVTISALLAFREKEKNWKIFAIVGGLLGLTGIFTGGTRGALLGLLVGIAVLMIRYFFTLKDHKKVRIGIGAVMGTGVAILALLFAFRTTTFVSDIPAVGRLLNTNIADLSGNTRIMAWDVAIQAWEERPIFGWGPNNYYYAFNTYYPEQILRHGWPETWFDNAHNIIMNTLAVQGAVGIITYLSIFGVAIFVLWRAYKEGRIDQHVANISMAFLVAHLTQAVFVFENPTSYLYFFFFLAFIASQTQKQPEHAPSVVTKPLGIGTIVMACLIGLILVFSTDIRPARANMASLKAVQALYSNPDQAILYFHDAVDFNSPHIDDIRLDFARTIAQLLPQYIQAGRVEDAERLFDLAYAEVQKNYVVHPKDIRIHIQQANLAQQGVTIKKTADLLLDAERVMKEALILSPGRQQLVFILSSTQLRLGRGEEAIAPLQSVIDEMPDLPEAWWRLALLHYDMGNKDMARSIIDQAIAQGVNFKDGTDKQISDMIIANTTTSTSSTAAQN